MSRARHQQSLLAAVEHLREVDPQLRKVIDQVGPPDIDVERGFDPFLSLARSIVFQQLHARAAETIHGRLVASFGGTLDPAKVAKARILTLKKSGLSNSKAKAVQDLARRQRDGLIPTAKQLHKMEDDAIIDTLTEVFGIGPWTVQMMLMFRMGRMDVLPVEDYGVRKGYSLMVKAKDMVSKDELRAGAEPWRPFRSIGSWYMWRVLDQKLKT